MTVDRLFYLRLLVSLWGEGLGARDPSQGRSNTELYPSPSLFYLEKGSCHLAEAGLKLANLLPQPPKSPGLQACNTNACTIGFLNYFDVTQQA